MGLQGFRRDVEVWRLWVDLSVLVCVLNYKACRTGCSTVRVAPPMIKGAWAAGMYHAA